MEQRGQVVVIGATNRLSAVDPAALRPGRFGVHLVLSLPDAAERAEILRIHLRQVIQTDSGPSLNQLLEYLVPRTTGCSGAHIAYLCQTAKLAAWTSSDADSVKPVRLTHFDYALEALRSGSLSSGGPAEGKVGTL